MISRRIQIQAALLSTMVALAVSSHAQTAELPTDIERQLPTGYEVMTFQSSDFNKDGKVDYVLVVNEKNVKHIVAQDETAPRRPLLVFIQGDKGRFALMARNDDVVFAADEGGQCDPFLDGGEGLAVKGVFFTVQNSVACGSHWSDYIMFRYSTKNRNFIFHKRIFESLDFNHSSTPGADALVPGKRSVTNANKKKPIMLSAYKPDA